MEMQFVSHEVRTEFLVLFGLILVFKGLKGWI